MGFDQFGNYSGLAFAQNAQNQTNNFLAQQQNMNNYAQNAWQGVTGNLTQDPSYYAAQGIAYQGQIGPVQDTGAMWAGKGGGARVPVYTSEQPADVWSQGAAPVPYVNETQNFWDRYGATHGGMSSYAPNSTYSPPQYTPTPQTPMSGSPGYGLGYNPDQFMPSSTPYQTYGQPGVGGAGGSPPVGQGYNQAAMWGYLQANPDVLQAAQNSGQDIFAFANQHLNQYGRNEGRSLGDASGFDAAKSAYLQNNPDVAAAGIDPWQHYQQYGRNEGREGFGMMAGGLVGPGGSASAETSPDFNDRWGNTPYTAGPGYKLPGMITDGVPNTGSTPFEQRWNNMDPNPDATPYSGNAYGSEATRQYFQANPDVAAALPSGMSPDQWAQQHYSQYGAAEGRNGFGMTQDFGDRWSGSGGQYFQPGVPEQYYGGGNTYSGADGTQHQGVASPPSYYNPNRYPGAPSQDTLQPGDYFPAPQQGASQYLQNNPDVAASGMDPWQHYQQFGQAEGRAWPTMAADDPSFNDRWADQYGDQSMYNYESPGNAYDTFQKGVSGKTATGIASTYDPYHPGWRTGGPENASGGVYDPNGYHAAIQTSLRNQFGGVPYGKQPGQAVVQGPGGQQVLVDVNNVGPLTQGRIIDLSTKAMQYLNPAARPNSGLLPNTTVTSLPYGTSYQTGPTGPVGPYGPQQATPGIPLPTYDPRAYTPTSGYVKGR